MRPKESRELVLENNTVSQGDSGDSDSCNALTQLRLRTIECESLN